MLSKLTQKNINKFNLEKKLAKYFYEVENIKNSFLLLTPIKKFIIKNQYINNIESNNQKILDNWKNNSWFCNYNIFDTMNEKNYNYQMFYHCIPPYQHDKNITMFPIINTPRK